MGLLAVRPAALGILKIRRKVFGFYFIFVFCAVGAHDAKEAMFRANALKSSANKFNKKGTLGELNTSSDMVVC